MTRIEIQTTLASISLSLFTIYTDILLSLSSFLPYSSSLPHKSYHLSASHTVLFNIAYHTRRFVHPNVRPQNGIMALPTGFLPNLPLLIPSTKLIPLLLHQQVIFSSCLTRHFFFSLLPHDNFLICFLVPQLQIQIKLYLPIPLQVVLRLTILCRSQFLMKGTRIKTTITRARKKIVKENV